ncbi:CDP-glycerol glycerophosphotransferase family protein [candidate division CSSED10-310 bacterium]|uniref:CDP-glycerol glycerophosphotransferase family protein n=1 Tax=candidate division CSSED10-310 bacterium TaxID=2855610 RepID=A0ABV6Z2T9_UNCC1
MSFFKEIKDFYHFYFRTAAEEKSIVFYAEHEGYYPNLEGLLDELLEKENKTICYITSDIRDPVLWNPSPAIKPFYIKYLLTLFMLFIKCKVFVMTMTDLHQYHIKRSANAVKYVYVFHSLVSTHMMYLKGAFDHYDSVLCCGPYHNEEIRRYEELHNLKPKTLVDAGYYRLERIYASYQEYLKKESGSGSRKTTVLIAPSWGDGNILEACGIKLVELLLTKRFNVIVRPHPETIRKNPGLIKELENKFEDNESFILEKSVATDDSLFKGDVMICDCSGVAIEYAFGTERPVLFLDVPYKIRNPEYKALGIEPFELSIRSKIGIILSLNNLDILPQEITRLIDNRVKYKKMISELREKNVYAFGRSSAVGAEHINNLLSNH